MLKRSSRRKIRKMSRVKSRKISRNNSKRIKSRKTAKKTSRKKSKKSIKKTKKTSRKNSRRVRMYMPTGEMPTGEMPSGETRFIHFGCWNRNGCDKTKPTSNLTKVINKLDNYIETIENSGQPKVEFITIAGDNYYPDKVKINGQKVKTIVETNMKSGFECLPKQIPKYLLLGNHDLENIDDCKILTYQQNEYAKLNDNTVFDDNTKDDIMHKILGNDTIGYTVLIMIDTTMYDEDYKEKGEEEKRKYEKELLNCYNKIEGLKIKNIDTLENLIQNQENRITNLIKNMKIDMGKIKNVIVMGHHPIVSIKTKEKDDGKIKTLFSGFNLLKELYYNTIYSKLNILNTKINYYYLCADVHMYQQGTIAIKNDLVINQYIIGTGGAESDTLKDNFKTFYKKDDLTYTLNENKVNFGFLDCVIKNDGKMDFKFIEI